MGFLWSALVGAAGAVGARAVIASQDFSSWERSSFSGKNVSLTEGLVASAGMIAGSVVAPAGVRVGALTAIGSAAAAGYIDDQLEDRFPAQGKGLRGHLGALREGKLTSGALKIAVIGGGAALGTLPLPRSGSAPQRLVTWVCQSALVAGSANLVNLLDLRPGRALKVCGIAALPLAVSGNGVASAMAGSVLATGAVCAPDDLSGKTMLGDFGANALGAGLGYAVAASPRASVRAGVLGAVVVLTLASEKVSFSKVIEANPALSWVDQLGRS
ncbi:MAG: beta-carotene 15,15'-monooxygenase [Ancrocorticia sp.]